MSISAEEIVRDLHQQLAECKRSSVETSSPLARYMLNGYADILLDAINRISAHGRRAARAYRDNADVRAVVGKL